MSRALPLLDGATAARVRPALAWLRDEHGAEDPSPGLLARYLREELTAPERRPRGRDDRESHEVAWALGDLFERAGLAEQAALCRSSSIHEVLAVWRWAATFEDVPGDFWRPAVAALDRLPVVPARVGLSLASASTLLSLAAEGLELTAEGHLAPGAVLRLDDRFRWTEEFPWMRPTGEADVPPLRFLHEHLVAQRLLRHSDGRLRVTAEGASCVQDVSRLWRAVVTPAPRWSREFEQDALGVMAASLLRGPTFTPGRVAEELTHVLASKWRSAADRRVFDAASLVVQAWYQLGVPLGWWDTGRGPADRRPNAFGRTAAAAVLRSLGARAGSGAADPGGDG